MKRIAHDVAVETLLYTMPAGRQIHIIDVDYSSPIKTTEEIEEWVFESARRDNSFEKGEIYTVDQILHNWEFTQIAKAKIRRTEVANGRLVLVIDTKREEY